MRLAAFERNITLQSNSVFRIGVSLLDNGSCTLPIRTMSDVGLHDAENALTFSDTADNVLFTDSSSSRHRVVLDQYYFQQKRGSLAGNPAVAIASVSVTSSDPPFYQPCEHFAVVLYFDCTLFIVVLQIHLQQNRYALCC